MKIESNQHAGEGIKSVQSMHEKLDRLMAKHKPSKRDQVHQVFRDLYPRLEVYIAMDKPLKEVLAAFNELSKSKVCTRTFNDMLAQERARRDDIDDPACCAACGQPLKVFRQAAEGVAGQSATSAIDPPSAEQEGIACSL